MVNRLFHLLPLPLRQLFHRQQYSQVQLFHKQFLQNLLTLLVYRTGGTTRYITPAWNVWCTDSDTHGIYVGYRATWTRYDGSTYIDDNFWINTYVTLDNTYTFHKDASFSCDGNNPELILDMFILEIINDSVGINASPSLAIDNPEVYGFKLLKSIRYSIDCYDLLQGE